MSVLTRKTTIKNMIEAKAIKDAAADAEREKKPKKTSKYEGMDAKDILEQKALVKKKWQDANADKMKQYRKTYYEKNKRKTLETKRLSNLGFSEDEIKRMLAYDFSPLEGRKLGRSDENMEDDVVGDVESKGEMQATTSSPCSQPTEPTEPTSERPLKKSLKKLKETPHNSPTNSLALKDIMSKSKKSFDEKHALQVQTSDAEHKVINAIDMERKGMKDVGSLEEVKSPRSLLDERKNALATFIEKLSGRTPSPLTSPSDEGTSVSEGERKSKKRPREGASHADNKELPFKSRLRKKHNQGE